MGSPGAVEVRSEWRPLNTRIVLRVFSGVWGAKIQVSRSERADFQARRINAPHGRQRERARQEPQAVVGSNDLCERRGRWQT
jgi:hypothetical protein